VQDTNLICPPRLPQRAALAALTASPGRQVLRLSYRMLDEKELAEALARHFQGLKELAGG